jgi:hypothetical protein
MFPNITYSIKTTAHETKELNFTKFDKDKTRSNNCHVRRIRGVDTLTISKSSHATEGSQTRLGELQIVSEAFIAPSWFALPVAVITWHIIILAFPLFLMLMPPVSEYKEIGENDVFHTGKIVGNRHIRYTPDVYQKKNCCSRKAGIISTSLDNMNLYLSSKAKAKQIIEIAGLAFHAFDVIGDLEYLLRTEFYSYWLLVPAVLFYLAPIISFTAMAFRRDEKVKSIKYRCWEVLSRNLNFYHWWSENDESA